MIFKLIYYYLDVGPDFMYSDKVIIAAGLNNDTAILLFTQSHRILLDFIYKL